MQTRDTLSGHTDEAVSPFGQKIGQWALLASDFWLDAGRLSSPSSFRVIWLWRFLVAILVLGFNLWALLGRFDYIDPVQMRAFFLSSLPYVAAESLGLGFHLLARGRWPRAEWLVSLGVMILEVGQVVVALSYVGMGQAVSLGYVLVMIILYGIFVDAVHGLLAFLGTSAALSLVYALIDAGVIADGRLYTTHQGAAFEEPLQVFIQTLTLFAAVYLMSESAGARLRWQRRQLEAQNRYIIDKILRRYLPPGLIDDLLERSDAWNRPRRTEVTVFFSDLVGFTRQSERLDVDLLGKYLDEYLSEAVQIAHRFGGTIDKFIGDAVMVIFGAPAALPPREQASRAVQMALCMQRMTRELSSRWTRASAGFEPVARMGIHFGEAVVGNFGGTQRSDFTAVGDTVNIAARLEQSCRPGQILVSESVFGLLEGQVPGRCLGEVLLRNRERPVSVYEIVQPSTPEAEPLAPLGNDHAHPV